MKTHKCDYCNNMFASKQNLKSHQNTAKYCLKLQGNNIINTFVCEYCNMNFTQKANLDRHRSSCTSREVAQNRETIKTLKEYITKLEKQVEDLQKKIDRRTDRLENTLENIAIKGVEKSTTTNTQNINLLPLTENHMKSCSGNLTLDHIKEGAIGYAKYALEHPFKDRLVCVDYARKKIKYMNNDGFYVVDPQMTKITPKFFKSIEEQNNQLIDECIQDIRMKIEDLINSAEDSEGWDLEDFESEQARLHAFLGILLTAKRNVKEASKNKDNEITDDFVKHVVNTIVSYD